MAARPDDGAPITFVYGDRAVAGWAWHRGTDVSWFMAESSGTTPKSEFVDYEGSTWERGWTDGVALLAAHALLSSA